MKKRLVSPSSGAKAALPWRKLIRLIIILLSITFLSYALIELAPGDPADIMLRASGVIPSEAAVQTLRAELGLDKPFLQRYFLWLAGALHGDLGTAFSTGLPVTDTLLPALGRTVVLTLWSFALTLAISIPLGMLCSRHRDSLPDRIIRIVTYVAGATPNFVLGVGVMYLLAVKLKLLPAIANGHSHGYVMPVLVLTIGSAAWMVRQVRTAALENRSEGYLLAMKARGLSPLRLERYVLRSAMLPILASLGGCLGSMLAGAVVVENIFSLSGLGKLALSAINARDFPLLQGFILWIALIYYLINFGCDSLYAVFEPRMRGRDRT